MTRQRALDTIVGLASPNPNNVPAQVVREQARIAAADPVLNKGKHFFGYARLVPQADIAPEDQVLYANSDDVAKVSAWFEKCKADPAMIWVGVWDNQTKALIMDGLGSAVVTDNSALGHDDPAPVTPKGSAAPVVLGVIAAGLGLFIATRK